MRIVVARNPKGGMVSGHGKLRMFFFHHKIGQILLLGKLITETKTIVEQAKAQNNETIILGLIERHLQFIVMIAYGRFLSPYGFPRFIKGGRARTNDTETCHKVGLADDLFRGLVHHNAEVRRVIWIFLLQF